MRPSAATLTPARVAAMIAGALLPGCAGDGDPMLGSGTGATTDATQGQTGPTAATGSTADASPDSTAAHTSTAADDSDGSGGFQPVDCSDPCADGSEAGIAVCYACRCKNAMDGWLPSVEQLQCSQAEALTIYTADLSGATPQLVAATGDVSTCANPALLTESCNLGSRLGQLRQGDVYAKWICREPFEGQDLYADVGVILHNTRNGASCWFDDIDSVTGDDDLPDLDLMAADEANLQHYLETFYFTDGDSCTRDCHDADPFVYTPYFAGIQWQTGPWVHGPHHRVTLQEELAPVPTFSLLSPEVTVCTACHRLGSSGGCDFLSPDALAQYKTPAHEAAIVDAMDPSSPNWSLAYWMPEPFTGVATLADWTTLYGPARDRIVECCNDPGVSTPACLWEPVNPP